MVRFRIFIGPSWSVAEKVGFAELLKCTFGLLGDLPGVRPNLVGYPALYIPYIYFDVDL